MIFNKPEFMYKPLNIKELEEFLDKTREINSHLAEDFAILRPVSAKYVDSCMERIAEIASEKFTSRELDNVKFYANTETYADERLIKMGIRVDKNVSGINLQGLPEEVESIIAENKIVCIEADRPFKIIFNEKFEDCENLYLIMIGEIYQHLRDSRFPKRIEENVRLQGCYNKYVREDGQIEIMQFCIAETNDTLDSVGETNMLPICILYDPKNETCKLDISDEINIYPDEFVDMVKGVYLDRLNDIDRMLALMPSGRGLCEEYLKYRRNYESE